MPSLTVTPYVGVWIETRMNTTVGYECVVTPYVGVWIETPRYIGMNVLMTSLLMWECGLKLGCDPIVFGSWCHSLCGSVD